MGDVIEEAAGVIKKISLKLRTGEFVMNVWVDVEYADDIQPFIAMSLVAYADDFSVIQLAKHLTHIVCVSNTRTIV